MQHTSIDNVAISFIEIKELYPNEWVLIGNPELRDLDVDEAVVDKLISGVVLFHSKNKIDIGNNAKNVTSGYFNLACVYTGEVPKNRRFWLSNW